MLCIIDWEKVEGFGIGKCLLEGIVGWLFGSLLVVEGNL